MYTQQDVNNWFAQNPNATPEQIYKTAQANGVNANSIANYYGVSADTIGNYVNAQGWSPLSGMYSQSAYDSWAVPQQNSLQSIYNTQQPNMYSGNNSLSSLYKPQNSVYNSGINNNTTTSTPMQMASSTKGNYLSGSYSNNDNPVYGNRMNQMNNSRGAGFFQPPEQMSF